MKKRCLFWSAYFFIVIIVGVGAIEATVRWVLLPRNFFVFEVHPDQFPQFSMQAESRVPGFTTHQGRREKAPRGTRPKSAAFIGDSQTFGALVGDDEVFTEVIQASQSEIDIYNFGVPGYGIPEIQANLTKVFKQTTPEIVVYIYNLNDPIVAMAGSLPLLTKPETRFTAIERYQGSYGHWKLFAKDHLKSLFLIPSLISGWRQPLEAARAPAVAAFGPAVPVCIQLDSVLADPFYRAQQDLLVKLYRDPEILQRIAAALGTMAKEVEAHGSRFLIVFHYDLNFMTPDQQWISQVLASLAKRFDVPVLDLYALYKEHQAECGFYMDNGHLASSGHRLVARRLLVALWPKTAL